MYYVVQMFPRASGNKRINVFLLRKARPFITSNIAKILYHTIIQSYFDYCSPVWSNANKTLLNVLHILQKKGFKNNS